MKAIYLTSKQWLIKLWLTLKASLTAVKSDLAARWQRHRRLIWWTGLALLASVVTLIVLAYLWRRSPTVRHTVKELVRTVLSLPALALRWLGLVLAELRSPGGVVLPPGLPGRRAPLAGQQPAVKPRPAEEIPARPGANERRSG
jgi:ABC-type proline/glycine betaine transport system permease subunit